MTRQCSVTGKVALVGNKVSHANNRTKRRFLPSVKSTRLYSEALGRMVLVKLSTHGMRSVEHKGGLDAWLLGTAPSRLMEGLRPIREQIKAKAKPALKAKAPAKRPPSKRAVKATVANNAKKTAAK